MPYSDEEKDKLYKNAYNRGYQRGFRLATIYHLGARCIVCGNTNIAELEIHHITPLEKHTRNSEDWQDLTQLELRCDPKTGRLCHAETPTWRRNHVKPAA